MHHSDTSAASTVFFKTPLFHRLADLIAFAAGGLLVTAFAPFHWHSASLLAPTLVLLVWLHASPKRAMLRGLLFGLGFFGFGVSWVFLSIHRYGNLDWLLAGLITTLFIFLLAAFPAIGAYFFARFFPTDSALKRLLVFPSIWVVQESLRATLFTGFPWLLLGYTQLDLPLAGYLPIFGVYGVGFLCCLSSAIITFALSAKPNFKYLILLFSIWILGSMLSSLQWSHPIKEDAPIKVALIQGNIAQEDKWRTAELNNIFSRYSTLTDNNWKANLIVWPESAIPLPYPKSKTFLQELDKAARTHHTALLVGLPIESNRPGFYYNGLVGLGAAKGYYYKRHLVPLGEYLPHLPLLQKLIDTFEIPMSSFLSGSKHPQLLSMPPAIRIAPFICYEIAYAGLVATDTAKANLMVTITDDSWFGDSFAAMQHLQIAQIRSREAGRYQLFVSNAGPSAIISPAGQIVIASPKETPFALQGEIQAYAGSTPWMWIGGLVPIGLGLLLIGLFAWRQRANFAFGRQKGV